MVRFFAEKDGTYTLETLFAMGEGAEVSVQAKDLPELLTFLKEAALLVERQLTSASK
jgi:hypothetical protein